MNSKQRRRFIRANIGAATVALVHLQLTGHHNSHFREVAASILRNQPINGLGAHLKAHYIKELLRDQPK